MNMSGGSGYEPAAHVASELLADCDMCNRTAERKYVLDAMGNSDFVLTTIRTVQDHGRDLEQREIEDPSRNTLE